MIDYIPIFNDEKYCYCYSDGKFYIGKPTQMSKNSNIKILVASSLITFIGDIVNQVLENRINDMLFALMSIAGVVFSIAYAYHSYKEHEKTWSKGLLEVYLSKEQFEKYLSLGKKQLKKQILVTYTFFITGIFLFIFFYLHRNIYFWFFGTCAFYLFTTFFCSAKLLKKYRFYKTKTEDD